MTVDSGEADVDEGADGHDRRGYTAKALAVTHVAVPAGHGTDQPPGGQSERVRAAAMVGPQKTTTVSSSSPIIGLNGIGGPPGAALENAVALERGPNPS